MGQAEAEMTHQQSLNAERKSWASPDTSVEEKLLRERIRHPKLVKDLLLHMLPTQTWDVLEVGGGPLPVSDLIPFGSRLVIDPCTDAYLGIAPCTDHMEAKIEDDPCLTDSFDLVICTNALDHVDNQWTALAVMDSYLRRGGYMAIQCNENNALVHQHPSHQINLTAADIHRQLDLKYETVHELTYAKDGYVYGWKPYRGRCGQPAFALLLRKALA